MTPERRVKEALIDGFYKVFGNANAWHTSFVAGPVQQAGRPDFVLCVGGCTVWVEVKAKKNGLSDLQRRVLSRMTAAGCRVMVLRGAIDPLSNRLSGIESWVFDPDETDGASRATLWLGPTTAASHEFWDHVFAGKAP
jgi:hypothetical protein